MAALADGLGSAWTWILLGLVLVGLEMLAPGVFLIWLGLAALLTGLADALVGLPWQGSLLLFAVLSGASVLAGRALTRRAGPPDDAGAGLNQRGHAMIGQVFLLEEPIVGGVGRVRVGDSSWRIAGPDLPAGSRVRAVRLEGTTLVVEGSAPP